MKRRRVLVLMHEDLVPPEDAHRYSEKEAQDWRTERDVLLALREMGHEAEPLGVQTDLGVIRRAIQEFEPHVMFNLLEEFHSVPTYDQHVVSYLELMRQPYTGCNPRGLLLTHDKALSKKILTYHRIQSPHFAVFLRGRKVKKPSKLKFPLFVKSLTEDGSLGVAQASVVSNEEKLRERVEYMHRSLDTDVIAEEYIAGREIYAAVMGNYRLTPLPLVELTFGNLPPGAQPIATRKVKWDLNYQEKADIDLSFPVDLGEEVVRRIHRVAKRVYKALSVSGYARIDMRLTEAGEVYVIEVNTNPDVAYDEELCQAAEKHGLSYHDLLQRIMDLGLSYQPEWRRASV